MPIYEFECPSCKTTFDRKLAVVDRDDPQACPKCEAQPAKRKITGGNFELKGGGWYKDGYHK